MGGLDRGDLQEQGDSTPLLHTLKLALRMHTCPQVTIVKHWAKRRKVNEPYTGTLSSYCYALMCVHLLQTRSPPILPALQLLPHTHTGSIQGWDVGYYDKVRAGRGWFGHRVVQAGKSRIIPHVSFMPHSSLATRRSKRFKTLAMPIHKPWLSWCGTSSSTGPGATTTAALSSACGPLGPSRRRRRAGRRGWGEKGTW